MTATLITWLIPLLTSTPVVLASEDDGDGSGGVIGIGLALFTLGFIFYGAMYRRYRNKDKRHHHETETETTLHHVQAADTFTRSRTGLSNKRMSGANNLEVRYRGQGLRR